MGDVPGCDHSECLCNGRTVWIQREHISGKVINERQHFLYFFIAKGKGQWSISQTLNAANFLIGKESVNLCPHANDEIRWKYLSYRGTIENDDRSLDVGCVGECILTQTNNNTIGSTIKLKDGAETEVARFQYQMGKIGLSPKSIILKTQILRDASFEGNLNPYREGHMSDISFCRKECRERPSCVAFEWCSSARCQEKGIHNCKIYRMIDLRVKKLTSAVFNGIVLNPQRTIEIIGIRDQERSSVLGKTCSRNEISMEFPDPIPDACISVERTVKVLKEDATRACHSINSFTGLPSLTMDDVSEIWETLKSEDFIGEQRFFVQNVVNEEWMERERERDGYDI